MKPHLVLPLLGLAAVPALAGPPPLPGKMAFSTLTLAQARGLEGRRARFHVVLDLAPGQRGNCTVYDCAGHDDTLRTLWLAAGEEPAAEMDVEGVLRLR
jgi:hypothetical protein